MHVAPASGRRRTAVIRNSPGWACWIASASRSGSARLTLNWSGSAFEERNKAVLSAREFASLESSTQTLPARIRSKAGTAGFLQLLQLCEQHVGACAGDVLHGPAPERRKAGAEYRAGVDLPRCADDPLVPA